MHWYELATNPHMVTQQYSYSPLLKDVEVNTVTLSEDEPTISLTLSLTSLPDTTLRDWKAEGYNSVHLQLDFAGLQFVAVTRWSGINQGEVKMERTTNERIAVSMSSASTYFEFVAQTMTIIALKCYIVWDDNY